VAPERLRCEAEKLEAIGRFAAGVAHDFNNVLVAIRGYAELAAATADEASARPLREIVATAERGHELTRQLLVLGRRQALSPERFDLNDLPRAAASTLERLLGASYTVEVARGERAPVDADRAQLEQALVHLVLNARDAMPGGGRITVRTGVARVDDPVVGLSPGRYAMLRVSDHGEGIDSGTLERVFEPFFTTKPHGLGAGLGLATVHAVVAQSGGAVDAESEPGNGSTFTVYLPLAG
jgi:signal transduction histidine kinase